MAIIKINGISIDPTAQAPAIAGARLMSDNASKSDYLLVQTTHPITQQERDALEAKGATILEYVPESTYVVHYPATSLSAIRALPFVAWVNTYMRGFKINPALLPAPQGRLTRNLMDAEVMNGPQMD